MTYKWAIAAAGLFANLVLTGFFYSSYGLFVLPVSEEFGLSRADMNTGLVILSLGTAIEAPFIGRLLDRASVRWIMATGAVLFGAVLVCMALSSSPWVPAVLLGLVFPFAVLGGCSLAVPLLIVRWFPVQTARALVISQLGFSLGGVIVPPVAAMLIESQGWRPALVAMGIAGGLVMLVAALTVRDWPPEHATGRAPDMTRQNGEAGPRPVDGPVPSIAGLLRNPQFWVINLSGALVIGVSSALSISLVPFGHEQGLSLVEAATLVSVMSATGICGKMLLIAVGDRVNNIVLLTAVYLVGGVATGALLLSQSYWATMLAVAPLGLIGGITSAVLNAVVADRFGRSAFGTVTGLAQPLQSLSSMVAIRLAGEIFDRTGGYTALIVVVGAVKVVAASMIFSTLFAPARKRRDGLPAPAPGEPAS